MSTFDERLAYCEYEIKNHEPWGILDWIKLPLAILITLIFGYESYIVDPPVEASWLDDEFYDNPGADLPGWNEVNGPSLTPEEIDEIERQIARW